MSLCASYQSNFHFCDNKMLLFISDELFLCLTFPKYNLSISVVQFLKSLDSTIFVYKCLVTRNWLRVTEHHCCKGAWQQDSACCSICLLDHLWLYRGTWPVHGVRVGTLYGWGGGGGCTERSSPPPEQNDRHYSKHFLLAHSLVGDTNQQENYLKLFAHEPRINPPYTPPILRVWKNRQILIAFCYR